MKILHVLTYTAFGGIETYTRDLFPELERRGHRNVLITTGARLDGLEAAGRSVYFLSELRATRVRETRRLIATVSEILNRERPTVAYLHTQMNAQLADLIITRMPSVYFAHEYGAFSPSGALLLERDNRVCDRQSPPDWHCLVRAYTQRCNSRRPDRLLGSFRRAQDTRRWVRRVDAIVCDSNYVAERHAQAGFDRGRIHILASPVPLPPQDLHAPSPGDDRDPTILFCGRLVPGKGLAILLKALRAVYGDWRLVAAGDGPHRLPLTDLARTLGLAERVQFLGRVSRDQLSQLYREASVVVLPSLWPEPLGMVGLEAMSYARPVVASAAGGITDWLVDNETGFLAEPGNVEQLADRISRVLGHPALGTRLGLAGRALVERRFTLPQHVDRLLELFASVQAGRPLAEVA